jgi:glutamate formiminotransferase
MANDDLFFPINVSEGRVSNKLDEIVKSGRDSGLTFRHQDSSWGANRSVLSFTGDSSKSDKIILALTNLVGRVISLIDLRTHLGVHPRIGAVDVLPIVPLTTTALEPAKRIALQLGENLGRTFDIPIFLYELSSTDGRTLPQIRKGELSGLSLRLITKENTVDFGPPTLHASAGGIVLGVRKPLIAYNVTLADGKERVTLLEAKSIARQIRENLPAIRAIGWFIEEYQAFQVSCNLLDYNVCSLQKVFQEIEAISNLKGLRVSDSEIIGMVNKEALFTALSLTVNEVISLLKFRNFSLDKIL